MILKCLRKSPKTPLNRRRCRHSLKRPKDVSTFREFTTHPYLKRAPGPIPSGKDPKRFKTCRLRKILSSASGTQQISVPTTRTVKD